MRLQPLFALIAVWIVVVGCGADGCARQTGRVEHTFDTGFLGPESVVHDPKADVYLVSNVNGAARTKDDNGFISRIDASTRNIEPRWIDGAKRDIELHAPKGMAIHRRVLTVSDISTVRQFNLDTGEPTAAWEVVGAAFLNDVVVASDGTIYVSDTGLDAVPALYRLRDGKVDKVYEGADLGAANGLWMHDGVLLIADYASDQVRALTESGLSKAFSLPGGKLDGITGGSDGTLYVSAWATSAIYIHREGGLVQTLLKGVKKPADIGFDGKRGRVLVPQLGANRVLVVVPQR